MKCKEYQMMDETKKLVREGKIDESKEVSSKLLSLLYKIE
jgi:soluble cytochrome b562